MTKKHDKKCKEQYFQLARAVFESPALPVLSKSALVCLFRIMLEYLRHGGKDNGQLPITYKQFEEYGVHKDAIGPALCELEALGFIKIRRGRGGNAEFRHPSLFWITFLLGGSYEFRQFKTAAEAKAAVAKARRQQHRKKTISHPRKPGAKHRLFRPRKPWVMGLNSRPRKPWVPLEKIYPYALLRGVRE